MKTPTIEGPPEPGDKPTGAGSKLLWFIALWISGAAVTAAVAYALRALILPG